jgi:UDP-GlcNAc:undecaprenyl-phosphate GlcNAc-1-phosphate transferase
MSASFIPLLAVAFVVSALTCLGLARFAPRLRLLDLPDERKRHDNAIPLVGGIGILIGLLVATFGCGQGLPREALLPTLLLFITGVVDDMLGLRASLKLVVQVIGAWWLITLTGAALFAIPAPFAYGHWVLGPLAMPVTVVMVVALLNAINMIDGLDGLAGGCLGIAALGVAYAASVVGHADLAGIALAVFAAVLGFLLWNLRLPWQPRARIFLGDAGALGVGMLLCWLVFKLTLTPGPGVRVPTTVAFAPFAVPMIDMIVVAFWRLAERRNPMKADRGHSHHLLLEFGLPAAAAVRLIWLASALVTVATFVAWRLGVSEGRLLGVLLFASLVHMVWFRRSWLALRRRQAMRRDTKEGA